MNDHIRWMKKAIEISEQKMLAKEGGPFGAVIVKDGQLISEGWNQVTSTNDPTAHAEVMAIRKACEKLENFELSGAVLYTSCEPCPMCLSAVYWAGLSKIYYCNTRTDAKNINFDDDFIYTEIPLDPSKRSIPSEHIPLKEGLDVFRKWDKLEDKISY